MAIKDKKDLPPARIFCLRLRDEALFEPLLAKCVTRPAILGSCNAEAYVSSTFKLRVPRLTIYRHRPQCFQRQQTAQKTQNLV